MFNVLVLPKKAKSFTEAGMRKERGMRLLLIAALSLTTGCTMMGEPCEESWTRMYNAKGQVMYVKDETQCVSVSYQEPYTR